MVAQDPLVRVLAAQVEEDMMSLGATKLQPTPLLSDAVPLRGYRRGSSARGRSISPFSHFTLRMSTMRS